MLVLSRKENEAIVIDGKIVVTILEIRGNQIRLGIEAPMDVAVWRGELVASLRKGELAAV
jgi:carbon storage regulator